jgi:tetratricopeptide (TPR) repeat protein
MQEETTSSNWLDTFEPIAVVAAMGTSVATLLIKEAALGAIPLSLVAALNLVNRRRQIDAIQDQQRREITHLVQSYQENISAELATVKETSEEAKSQLDELGQQDVQSFQAIAALNTQAASLQAQTEQLQTEIAALQQLQAQDQATITVLGEQSQGVQTRFDELSTAVAGLQGAIAQLESSATDLGNRVQEQQSSAQSLAAQTAGVGELVDVLRKIDTLTQAISANPNFATTFHQRGLTRKCLERSEDHRAAMDDFSQAIKINPTHADAYFERGLLKSEFGQKQQAVDDLRMAAKFYFEQGALEQYEKARALSQEIHELISGSPSPEAATEQYLIENLFG